MPVGRPDLPSEQTAQSCTAQAPERGEWEVGRLRQSSGQGFPKLQLQQRRAGNGGVTMTMKKSKWAIWPRGVCFEANSPQLGPTLLAQELKTHHSITAPPLPSCTHQSGLAQLPPDGLELSGEALLLGPGIRRGLVHGAAVPGRRSLQQADLGAYSTACCVRVTWGECNQTSRRS